MKRLVYLLLLASCTAAPVRTDITLRLDIPLPTRSNDPDEMRISDLNFFLFGEQELLEERKFLQDTQIEWSDGQPVIPLQVLQEATYTAYICANLGYELPCQTREELEAYRYYMAYPDEYSRGMPMSGWMTFTVGEDAVRLPLRRMMARVGVTVDRTALDPGIRFHVRSLRVGNTPNCASLFGESRAETAEQLFRMGFAKTGGDVDDLNRDVTLGRSREVSVYLLENRQDGIVPETGSFLEAEIEYYSDRYVCAPGRYLIYRFYLGETETDGQVERNCFYHCTIKPEGDGLNGDGWRVDRSGLIPASEAAPRFDLSPAAYNERFPGDSIRFRLDILPPGTPVTIENIGYEDPYIAAVYDYRIHPDGHGITLYSKKYGTAHVLFSAGEPVNRDTLAFVVFHP